MAHAHIIIINVSISLYISRTCRIDFHSEYEDDGVQSFISQHVHSLYAISFCLSLRHYGNVYDLSLIFF